jgi:hypothetical protein
MEHFYGPETPETEEYGKDITFLAWCTVCNLLLIEDQTQRIADIVALDHINQTGHLVFVASQETSPYEP